MGLGRWGAALSLLIGLILAYTQDPFLGNTPLHLSVWYELPAMYDLLLSYDEVGADRLTNHDIHTPLKLAAQRGSKVCSLTGTTRPVLPVR